MLSISCVFSMTLKHFAVFSMSTAAPTTSISAMFRLPESERTRILSESYSRFIQIITSALALTKSLTFSGGIMALTSVSAECTDW